MVLRIIVVVVVILGVNYIAWRWLFSLNFTAWWIAIPLVLAETYSLIDVSLFGLTVWRSRARPAPPAAPAGLTVDVFITTYNESVDLVMSTARSAKAITYPHATWILDDGARPEMESAAAALGVGYITRGDHWDNRPRHSKAGNLNNALMSTTGEFILVLDADQIPRQEILDRTLGYFLDDRVALVQTPQIFGNVPSEDPLGSQAELFYGPIQQGKDGWNAAFFCGSNALLRRDALMQLGVTQYVQDVERAVQTALNGSRRVLREAAASVRDDPATLRALSEVSDAIVVARKSLARGERASSVTYTLQQRIAEVAPELAHEQTLTHLRSIDVDRADEAQPLMPLATISVTEDMATSMRLHAQGWKSVYHHELLAVGLAPEDLGTMLKQRLRWAQGTMQVMFRENPLAKRGLSAAQRLMYFSTMWSYLSGFAAIVYFAAPVIYLCLGILPVSTTAFEFFLRFLPFLIVNQLLFVIAARGLPTWRGQQYNLALFPVWIRAVTSAAANVFFHRPLDFVVTAKSRQESTTNWALVLPQIVVAVVLAIATVVGVVRLVLGYGEPIGTAVNLAWVVFDLIILSVLVPALRYRGYEAKEASN